MLSLFAIKETPFELKSCVIFICRGILWTETSLWNGTFAGATAGLKSMLLIIFAKGSMVYALRDPEWFFRFMYIQFTSCVHGVITCLTIHEKMN